MFGRSFRVALLLFQVVWLNVIVPGHRRGIVTLGGESCPQCAAEATSDPSQEPACCETGHSKKDHPQKQGDPAHCAICYFAARVTLPQTFDYHLDLLEELDRVVPPPAERVATKRFSSTYLGRAPPLPLRA